MLYMSVTTNTGPELLCGTALHCGIGEKKEQKVEVEEGKHATFAMRKICDIKTVLQQVINLR